ncbi:MAG: desulfoferrodoxin Dfx [Lachnospiraceae bacterium]|nr:desulfoferrodoxin Dfx [Lachnospiraceae bacterium]MBQ7506692.1 desulfoferrodoxin Dfx [Lachnospiraceae bacterium]
MVKILKCLKCGNVITYLVEKVCVPVCCGDQMTELKPNTTDGATEKHVPVIRKDGNKVTVEIGSAAHPMLEEHFIQFILLETKKGIQRVDLKPGDEPKAEFALVDGDEVVAAYEYCNLHGLWKADFA